MNSITQSFLNSVNYTATAGMTGSGTQAVPGQGGDVGKLLQGASGTAHENARCRDG